MKFNPKMTRGYSPLQLLALGLIIGLAVLYQLFFPGTPDVSLPDPTSTAESATQISPTAKATTQTPPTVQPATPTLRPSITPTRVVSSPTPGPSAVPGAEMSGKFDYFVLALSWSPDYCATSGGDDPQQCAIGRKLGFVLHGLWPQNNQGYPSNCTNEPIPQSVKARYPGLYPNDALYDHEWEKHGTCTGLSPAGFLTLSKQFKEAVAIPVAYQAPETAFRTTADQLEQTFAKANPSFPAEAFETNCSGSGRYLKEVYVCFTRTGQPLACGTEVHKDALKSCQSADFVVRNTR